MHKQHEMYMANASTNATRTNAKYIPLACVRCTRLGVGSARLHVGNTRRGVCFLDTNMLVSLTRNTRVGGQAPCEPPTRADLCCSGI